MKLLALKRHLYLDTYGWIAIVSLIICTVSGIILAIPYDVKDPYLSVRQLVTLNPAAGFIRNLHYWSAQSFLVFMVLHLYDHLKRSTEDNIRRRMVWFRLTLSLAATAYVMLSGFILKADPDAQQARNILSSLFLSVPLAGRVLDYTFTGRPGNWQIIYVQHIATATIFIFIAIYDHVHTIWAKGKTFMVMLILLSAAAWFFGTPLSVPDDLYMKGPWYFLGLQELFHYTRQPWVIMLVSFAVLVLLFFVPYFKMERRRLIKTILMVIFCLYLALSIVGFFFRGQNWHWQWPWDISYKIKTGVVFKPFTFQNQENHAFTLVNGNPESCLGCHTGMKGLSDPHNEKVAGCFSCHRGNPYTFDKSGAHRNMVKVPGNLSNAAETCGQPSCHPGIVERVKTGLMSTNSGIVTVDRYVFGDSEHQGIHQDIRNLGFSLASDIHLRNLCAGCHLGMEKQHTGPAAWLERGGGCNACHLHYDSQADKSLQAMKKNGTKGKAPAFHPRLDIIVSNDRCTSCHSRSGRIAMNYEGWHETSLRKEPEAGQGKFRTLPDGRIFTFISPDVHHLKGMSCIDCHNSYEIMGDGNLYAHEEEAVKVSCEDCHPQNHKVKTILLKDADRETQLLAWLHGYTQEKDLKSSSSKDEMSMIITGKGGIPFVNSRIDAAGNIILKQKLTGKESVSKPQSPRCYEGEAHDRLSCGACHTAWSPQCVGCHNSYDKYGQHFDMLRNLSTKGGWVEYAAEFLSDAPVLGVQQADKAQSRIITTTPGMILTVDKGSFRKGESTLFHRLYAPSFPHTTRREARNCKSCHLDPLAMGYGRGSLTLGNNGQWKFEAAYEKNLADKLPEDAWTGFLRQREGISSTRSNVRPFNIEEQKRILTVGACLTCHDESSTVMKESLYDFSAVYKRVSRKCVIPTW